MLNRTQRVHFIMEGGLFGWNLTLFNPTYLFCEWNWIVVNFPFTRRQKYNWNRNWIQHKSFLQLLKKQSRKIFFVSFVFYQNIIIHILCPHIFARKASKRHIYGIILFWRKTNLNILANELLWCFCRFLCFSFSSAFWNKINKWKNKTKPVKQLALL